jgi:hypothetical protein
MDTKAQLELLGKLMDDLAAEVGKLKDNPATRAEVIAQIIRLGTLYQAIKSGDDLMLQDR